MILLFVFFLCLLLLMQTKKEPFQNSIASSIVSVIKDKSSVMEGIHNRIASTIPYKHQYYKIKRYWRHR
jgi:hypothetical protein